MMKLSTYLLLFFFISIISCRKDSSSGSCGGRNTYNYLNEADKTKVPYNGFDSLVFVSNKNDTAICIGKGKEVYFNNYKINSNPDCQPDYLCNEVIEYKYSSKIDNKLNFIVSLKSWDYDGSADVLKIYFDNKVLGTIFSYLDTKYYSNHNVNGTLKSGLMFYEDTSYSTTFFYNLKEGILQFKTPTIEWNRIY